MTGHPAPSAGIIAPVDHHLAAGDEFRLIACEIQYGIGDVGRFAGQLSALREVTGRHDGYEIRGAISAPLIQTENSLVVNTGFTWKSAETAAYYYGVEGLYRPGSALNPFVKIGYSRPLSERSCSLVLVILGS